MSVCSMTGFGRAELSDDLTSITIEIKSVNNRFKDFRFRLPSAFSSLEIPLRKKIDAKFGRGSFEIAITYKKRADNSVTTDIDLNRVKLFLSETKKIVDDIGGSFVVNPVDLLKSCFEQDKGSDALEKALLLAGKTFDLAAISLIKSREEEGEKLVGVIKNHLKDYQKQVDVIKANASQFEDLVKDRLEKKFKQHLDGQDIDKSRFLQEVVYYLERMDISEELNRIDAHLSRLDKLVDSDGEMGRKIDFTIQELNRETNTIGSKSDVELISESVVQLKVHLEKIREQALNLE